MPAVIKIQEVERTELVKTDQLYGCEGEPTYVEFREARQGDYVKRESVMNNYERVLRKGDDGEVIVLRNKWNFGDLYAEEVYMTMAGCNIQTSDGSPMFKFKTVNGVTSVDMSLEEFKRCWSQLPKVPCEEMIEACHKKNFWDIEGKND